MKRLPRLTVSFLLLAVFASPAISSATIVTFEGLSGFVPNGHAGLDWTNVVATCTGGCGAGTGKNGSCAAINTPGSSLISIPSGTFDFNGATLTAGCSDGLDIKLEGFLGGTGGTKLFDQTVNVNQNGPVFQTLNYTGIDTLQISTSGGTPTGCCGGGGDPTAYVMDDFTFNDPNLTPDPNDPNDPNMPDPNDPNDPGDPNNPTFSLGHFTFYKGKQTTGTPKHVKFGPVALVDQFGPLPQIIDKPLGLGVPADKNGEGINDPNTHLAQYKLKKLKGQLKFEVIDNVSVSNQCNTDMLVEVLKPESLLVPTNKRIGEAAPPVDPNSSNLDHLLCYKIRTQKIDSEFNRLPKFPKGIQVVVTDQFFTDQRYDLKKPTKLCNPVDKSEDPNDPVVLQAGPNKGDPFSIAPSAIRNPDDHLVCYQAKLAKKNIPQDGCGCDELADPTCKGTTIDPKQPKQPKITGLNLNNQFGVSSFDTIKINELCIPSQKEVLAP